MLKGTLSSPPKLLSLPYLPSQLIPQFSTLIFHVDICLRHPSIRTHLLFAMANATLTNCLKAILSFLSSFSLGPIAIAFFAVLITIIHQVRHKNLETSTSNPDYSSVDDWYGPGNYYGWLITALAAVCQSNPERPEIVNPVHPNLANVPAANANAGNANLPADEGIISQLQSKIWALDAAAVAAAVAYPSVAAIDMLIRIYRKDFGHQFQAADRTVQVGWIFATFYLLHHIFGGGGVVYGRPRTPSLTTVLWTGLWTLITVAMSADNVVRDRLGSTALKVFTPFCVCIPFPMGVVALWRWRIRNHAVPAALVVGGGFHDHNDPTERILISCNR